MLVHRHSLVRSQVFLKDTDPLVIDLQVRVLRIGRQRIGGLFRSWLLRPGGAGHRGDRKKCSRIARKSIVMSTWHEKILDYEHE
jgi:hypothetical protein